MTRVRFRCILARLPAGLLAGLLAVVLAGCSGVPTSSAAFDVTKIADQAAPAGPGAPTPGQQPDQIVRGFVAATARPDLDTASGSSFAAARQYLTPDAQATWQPASMPVAVLTDDYRTDVSSATPGAVTISGQSTGVLDVDRGYHATEKTAYTQALTLVQVDGQWRISNPPSDLLLTASDFATAFRQRVLYFPNLTGTVVVPDVRHVVVGQTPANRANRLISLLLRGPSGPLADAVTSAFTPKSALRSNPSVDADGVLQVDLTGVDVSTPEATRLLAAQLVWTLSATSPRISITVDGEPLDPAQPVWTINAVSSFDPDRLAGTGQVASDPFYVTTTGAVSGLLDAKPVPGPLGAAAVPVVTAAQSSATGVTAAVVADPAGGQSLLLTQPAQTDTATPALKADTISAPSFTRSGEEVWVVQNGVSKAEVYRMSTTGDPSRERVGSDELAGKGPVSALALSPDGARVAVVAGERLYLGLLTPAPDASVTATAPEVGPTAGAEPAALPTAMAISHLSPIRPDLVHVGPVSFASSRELTVAAAQTEGTYRTLWQIPIDGLGSVTVSDRGIFGDIDGLAVAPGKPMLITFGGRVWQLQGSQTSGQWQSPVADQPFLNGSSPFYPS